MREFQSKNGHIVTLKEVAHAADVSVSTVSRALSGTGLVNSKTEARIQRTAEKLGYRTNTLARGLATRSSRLIGLVLHNLVNASFNTIADMAQARLRHFNYQMILCISGDDPEVEASFIDTLFDHRIDGLLITPTGKNRAKLEELSNAGVPLVTIMRHQPGLISDAVLPDDMDGAYKGTSHLISRGHRRIGLIVGPQETTSGRERLAGYLRALSENGVDVNADLIRQVPYKPEYGRMAGEDLLNLAAAPSAIFAANHEGSFGVMQAVADRKLHIPDDISLLCYEDAPWYRWNRPGISVVNVGAESMATLAVDRLVEHLSAKNNPTFSHQFGQEFRIGANLEHRDSIASQSATKKYVGGGSQAPLQDDRRGARGHRSVAGGPVL